jgi:ribosome biogenesis GTPase
MDHGASPGALPVEPPRYLSWGWNERLRAAFDALALAGSSPARVIAQHRSRYVVIAADGLRDAVHPRGRVAARAPDERPAVGDWVAVAGGEPPEALRIVGVLPRSGAFRRRAAGTGVGQQVVAANVDLALLVTAVPDDFNERRLERYATMAWEGGATPVVVITKADLVDDVAPFVARAMVAVPGAEVVVTSTVSGVGLDRLEALMRPGLTAVLLGSSGAGKSTLLNRLLGDDRMRTATVRADGRGRHTTTHRELVPLAGGALVIDTPGMRELQLWHASEGLDAAFADINALAAGCRFSDCGHDHEPGCVVRAAVASGALAPERLASWHALRRELDWLARRDDPVLAAEHRSRMRAMFRSYERFQRSQERE